MKQIQPPQILNDLYRDLRDRRLLIPAVALLVAIVAVPMLLGGSEPVETPPAPAVAGDEGLAVESAVLVGEPGIRNYSERLAALKSKNPFEQKFSLPAETSAGESVVTGSGDAAAADTGAAATGAPATGGSSTAPPVDPSSPAPGGDAPADDGVDSTAPTTPGQPEIRFYAGRVDVAIGELGEAKTYRDVRYLNFLPNDKAPVVAFIGLAEGGDRAIFSVSSDVNMGKGDGSCAPKKPDPCQFLTMKVGDERFMKYGIKGTPFRLKLLDTQIVRVPDPRDSAAG